MRAPSNGIEIEYETFGEDGDPPLLLVMGLGAQMITWDTEFCEGLVDRGFFVIRYDNRDVGLSTKIDVGDLDPMTEIMKGFTGGEPAAPYLLADMADDAVGLLDHLGIDRAHIVGASMGGMIAQAIAIAHPERVLSLTSIMSTTGDPDVGQPDPEVLPLLLEAAPTERDGLHRQRGARQPSCSAAPSTSTRTATAARAGLAFDRCFYPAGMGHQLLAIVASPSRSDGLRRIDINSLVVHGDADPLVNVSGGERTAEVIPGAELLDPRGHGPRPARPTTGRR